MNADNQSDMHPAHARIWELLPWYLNGTLDNDERDEVHRHLGECLVCNRELRRLECLEAAVSEPIEEHACTQAFARLSQQIRTAHTAPRWPERVLNMLREIFEPVPLIAGASLLVISSVLVGTIVVSGQGDEQVGEQPFQTLGNQQARSSSAAGHPLFRVVVRENGGDSGLEAWLSRHAAELVDGPSEIGVLTVRIPAGVRTFDSVIEHIRADQETLFIEPVDRVGVRPGRPR